MSFRNSSYSNSLFSNTNPAGNSVLNSRRGFNRRVVVKQSSLINENNRYKRILEAFELLHKDVLDPIINLLLTFQTIDISEPIFNYDSFIFENLIVNLKNIKNNILKNYSNSSNFPRYVSLFINNYIETTNTLLNSLNSVFLFLSENGAIALSIINKQYNNVIDFAVENYLIPLSTGNFEKMPLDIDSYLNTINPIKKLLQNPNMNPVVNYILYGLESIGYVRNIQKQNNELLLELDIQKLRYQKLLNDKDKETILLDVGLTTIISAEYKLSKTLQLYFALYGNKDGIDSIKLQQVREYIKNNPNFNIQTLSNQIIHPLH